MFTSLMRLLWILSLSLLFLPVAKGQVTLPDGGTSSWKPLPLSEIKTALSTLSGEALAKVIYRGLGRQGLEKGKVRLEGTTAFWAADVSGPVRVTGKGDRLLGEMIPVHGNLHVLLKDLENYQLLDWKIEADTRTVAQGQLKVEDFPYTEDSFEHPGVPKGRLETFVWKDSVSYPGTQRTVTVYLPHHYDGSRPACLMVYQDGTRHADRSAQGGLRVPVVFDNLIHQGKIPVTIGVFVDPGSRVVNGPVKKAFNRSLEYDSLGDHYVRFLTTEIVPEATKRYGLNLRNDPSSRAIAGGSSGGICAFTAAWERPDYFGKVLCWVGTFVDIRGGNAYPSLVRKTERKPIRVYLLDGLNDLDNQYGNWPLANREMEASLKFMNYDYRMDWTQCFHGSKGMSATLPAALTWLWRDVR